MNSKIQSFNVQYLKSLIYVDESKLRIGAIIYKKCRFFNVIHKTTRKYYKQIDYYLKMEIIDTKYNGFDYYFLTYKIIDFSPYEFKNEFYINSQGIKINKEPFIYGQKIAGFPDTIHGILYSPVNLVIKRPIVKNKRENDEKSSNLCKNSIVLQIKTGIQRKIDDYYMNLDSPSKRRINMLSENLSDDVIVKRRKSLDENDENNDELINQHHDNKFIEDFIEKSKLTNKTDKKSLMEPEKSIIVSENQTKKKIDAKALYKQILAKHGR